MRNISSQEVQLLYNAHMTQVDQEWSLPRFEESKLLYPASLPPSLHDISGGAKQSAISTPILSSHDESWHGRGHESRSMVKHGTLSVA